MKYKLLSGFIICVFFSAPAPSLAAQILYNPKPDSPIGAPNPEAAAEVSEYAFLIGDWDVEITIFQKGRDPFSYKAKWHNHWIINGYAVMQEWRGPYSTGAEFRTYDAEKGHWIGKNIYYPSPAKWYENTAKLIDDKMIVTTERTDNEGKQFLTREVYYDLQQNSFKIKAEVSYDNGNTWGRGGYEATSTRSSTQ